MRSTVIFAGTAPIESNQHSEGLVLFSLERSWVWLPKKLSAPPFFSLIYKLAVKFALKRFEFFVLTLLRAVHVKFIHLNFNDLGCKALGRHSYPYPAGLIPCAHHCKSSSIISIMIRFMENLICLAQGAAQSLQNAWSFHINMNSYILCRLAGSILIGQSNRYKTKVLAIGPQPCFFRL